MVIGGPGRPPPPTGGALLLVIGGKLLVAGPGPTPLPRGGLLVGIIGGLESYELSQGPSYDNGWLGIPVVGQLRLIVFYLRLSLAPGRISQLLVSYWCNEC